MALRPGFQKCIASLLLLAFSQQAVAASKSSLFEREKQNVQQLSEFIYGDEMDQRLMPVTLLGAVRRPGIYHLPVNTDLTTLLAIAGGTAENPDMEEILIKNESVKKVERVDFSAFAESRDARAPLLKGNDIVFIPEKSPAISGNTVLAIGVIGTVMATILTGILIKKEL